MTDLNELKLFATTPHPCSYLDDRDATTVFIDPEVSVDQNLYSQLTNYGFRRSGKHIYRPACKTCQACIPIRVDVETFTPNRSQQRCLRKNKDLTVTVVSTIDTDEHYTLYAKYIEQRHSDGDMYPPKRDEYRSFLSAQWGVTKYLEFRNSENNLIGVAVADQLENGISAVYTFFDPDEQKRSLGVYAVLAQIAWAQKQSNRYVYLGYWIKECQKMSYKTLYKPFELFINNQWLTFI